MIQPPRGTVTFLFTDIEGSTKLWQLHPNTMDSALKRHHEILSACIAAHGGYVFQIIGDALCAAFPTANDGLEAALGGQRSLTAENWGEIGAIHVRMALHTGQADLQPGEYTSGEYVSGMTLNRTARLLSAGHGGQMLLSLPTAELVRDHLPDKTTLRDLGLRRLKDLIRPEQVFQVVTPDLPSEFAPLKTLDVHPHNLPVQLTSFIGREHEMAEVKRLLLTTHLLTFTGIGGTGKTRMAVQVGAELIDEYPGGVWLVELAPVTGPALIEQTVAAVLGVREQAGRTTSDLLVDYVRNGHLLLILDNCEHLVEACAQLADRLLKNCPKLKILATSRLHLNLSGEQTYKLPPLAVPDAELVKQSRALTQYEAVRLFIERARAVQGDFILTDNNAQAVAQICTHLDGIPLAIELAAARVRHLSPAQILARLNDRFNLLTGGSRATLPRQQTLRATLEWSYDLLSERDKTLFNRLAVFMGSFTLEAAENVCTDKESSAGAGITSDQVLDMLGSLVDHSLVLIMNRPGESRYSMLETIREYAFDKISKSDELSTLRDRHLDYYLRAFHQRRFVYYSVKGEWFERWIPDYNNLRAAMEYAIEHNLESAINLLGPLVLFCDFRYHMKETLDWAMLIYQLTEAWPVGRLRAMAIWHAGDRLVDVSQEFAKGEKLLKTALEMAQTIEDKDLILDILQDLFWANLWHDDYTEALSIARQRLEICYKLNRGKSELAGSLWEVGEALSQSGDKENGREYLEQALKINREENNSIQMAFPLESLAKIEHFERNNARALELYAECIEIERQEIRGHVSMNLLSCGFIYLEEGRAREAKALFDEYAAVIEELRITVTSIRPLIGMAGVMASFGQDDNAVRLLGHVEVIAENTKYLLSELTRRVYDPLVAGLKTRFGEAKFNRLWEEGRRLTPEQAIELAKQ